MPAFGKTIRARSGCLCGRVSPSPTGVVTQEQETAMSEIWNGGCKLLLLLVNISLKEQFNEN